MSDGPEHTRGRGAVFERLAEQALARAGLEVLARNVHAGGAELDLVMRDPTDGTVVFVEVRSRADDARGLPEETVGPQKRARIRRGATAWLVREGLWERVPVRFDVVAITGEAAAADLRWYRAAFE